MTRRPPAMKPGPIALASAAGWAGFLWLASGCAVPPGLPYPEPKSNFERGMELFLDGRMREAAEVLRQASLDEPENPIPPAYRGLALVELGRPREALEPLERARGIAPELAEAHYGLGLAYEGLQEISRARERFLSAVELNPTHAAAHLRLGLLLERLGQTELGLYHLERFLELAPAAPQAGAIRKRIRS